MWLYKYVYTILIDIQQGVEKILSGKIFIADFHSKVNKLRSPKRTYTYSNSKENPALLG